MKPDYKILITTLLLMSPAIKANDDPRLFDFVQSNNIEAVTNLLKQEADVNQASADGTTALHWAAHTNNTEIAKLLIQTGADANKATDYGVTPLWLACTNRSSDMIETLLSSNADPDASLWTGETALMNCARTGATDAVAKLLGKDADVNATENKKGQTALMWAAADGHAQIVQMLIQHGANISIASSNGFTPLMFAARSGDVETARTLIEAGANPNEATTEFGNTLVVASAGNHESLALYLLEAGADPNIADENGITPLHYAIMGGFSALNGVRYDKVYRIRPSNMHKLVNALLMAGADSNAQITKSYRLGPDGSPFGMTGATPLFLAAVSADVHLMQLLLEYGADSGINTVNGTTPLIAAARAACTGSCAFLGGGNQANEEETEKAFQAVKAAVEMGVDINARDEEGQTAIHMAAFTGSDDIVRFLAEQGADINVKNNYGETPWSMASGISPVLRYRGLYGNHESTAHLLEQLGATRTSREALDPNAPPPPGQ